MVKVMTKKLISIILALTFIVCLIPAGAISASAAPTELNVTWTNGAVGGPTNNSKYKFISNNSYRCSDIITIEKAGTKVYYTAPTKAGLGHTLLAFSTWVKQGDDWVIDKAGANVDGTFLFTNSIGQTVVDGGVRYEFIPDHASGSATLQTVKAALPKYTQTPPQSPPRSLRFRLVTLPQHSTLTEQ